MLNDKNIDSYPNFGLLVQLGSITSRAKELKAEISAEYNVFSYETTILSSYNLRDWYQSGTTGHSESDLFINGTLKIPLLKSGIITHFLGPGITFIRAKWESIDYGYSDSETAKDQGTDNIYGLHLILGTDILLEKFLKFFIKAKYIVPIYPSGNTAIQIIGGFLVSP